MPIDALPKKRGRPATGKDPVTSLRLPLDLVAALDKVAGARGISRSQLIRTLCETHPAVQLKTIFSAPPGKVASPVKPDPAPVADKPTSGVPLFQRKAFSPQPKGGK